jgi:hypothetical protein
MSGLFDLQGVLTANEQAVAAGCVSLDRAAG